MNLPPNKPQSNTSDPFQEIVKRRLRPVVLPLVQDMASVPDPAHLPLLTFMQTVRASGHVSVHCNAVGTED